MSMKAEGILLSIPLLFSISTQAAENPGPPVEKPNILLILADDLGYEKLGCYGGLGTSTPNLDKMAEKGALFTRTYTSPVCTPSRMSLYTGSYTPRHQYTKVLPIHLGSKEVVDFENRFPTYAQSLKEAGYQTSVTGKWQLGALEFYPDHCKSAGFDSWCVWQIWKDNRKTVRYWEPTINRDGQIMRTTEKDFGPDMLTNYVIDRMKAAKEAGEPFLIHHNMLLPHDPIIETPDDVKAGRGASLDHMISYLDKQVGILLNALNELHLTDQTIVFFMGDNGTFAQSPRMTTQGEVAGGKYDLNDGGSHVPFIAYAPGRVPANSKVNDLIDFADFFPTICELAGANIPRHANPDGISFVKPLTGKGAGERQWVTSGIDDDFFIFDGEWRLHAKDSKLFDCRQLPNEAAADETSAEAKKAREKLAPVVERLKQIAVNN
ncbi:sulfatase-like hydrolase/transferase [Gaoshiqia sp. Z1-71]|uniref:sulfatase-like hydrolase/transferase n=1 Tax=Gaoshiqia hydrogeniformans TaxID=3290090 RepID=UPI003BF8A284